MTWVPPHSPLSLLQILLSVWGQGAGMRGFSRVTFVQMTSSALSQMGIREGRLTSSVSSEGSGGFSRVLGSHTHSLFLWPEKHLPKESRSIKRVWLVCTAVHSGLRTPSRIHTPGILGQVSAAWWTAWRQQAWPAPVGVFGSPQAAHWP